MISHSRELNQYCSEPLENIENYDKAIADSEQTWQCHHRAEVLPCGVYSRRDLIKTGLYWNRPASELIFLTHSDHRRLHNLNQSQETHRSRSSSMTNNPFQSTPIEMARLSDGTTKTFPSMAEAGRWLRENGYPRASCGNIQECCAGKHRFVYGAKWRYL